MKTFYRLLLTIGTIFSCLNGYSQVYNELKIGDIVPDVTINNIINFSTKTAKISDFRGKLLILDFWSTWCQPCVASFPKMDSLQSKFDGKVQILPVTPEDEKTVTFFLNKMQSINKIFPASIVNDRILHKLFKHIYIPHYVWISNEGKVVAITDGENVTETNINTVINGNTLSLPLKKDIKISMLREAGKPIFFISNMVRGDKNSPELVKTPESSVMYNSTITGYVNGLISSSNYSDSTLITVSNHPIYWLYRIAFWHFKGEMLNQGKTIVEIPDSTILRRITDAGIPSQDEWDVWAKNNLYCYQLKVPLQLVNQQFDIMLDDLNRLFGFQYGIEGVKEKRKQKYLALVRTTKEDKLTSTGGESINQMNSFYYKLQNTYIGRLIIDFRQTLQLYPYLEDETNIKQKIDMELNCNLGDLLAVNKELEKYGLQIVEKEKMTDIGIIRLKKQ